MSCGSITTEESSRLGLFCPCPFDDLLKINEQSARAPPFPPNPLRLDGTQLIDIKNAFPEIVYTQLTFHTHLIFKVLPVVKL